MNRSPFFYTALLLAGCAGRPAADGPAPPASRQGLPGDASRVAERLAGCTHFAGETGDNAPEREEEIRAAMARLGCDRIDRDVAVIRARYAGDEAVGAALDEAAGLERNEPSDG